MVDLPTTIFPSEVMLCVEEKNVGNEIRHGQLVKISKFNSEETDNTKSLLQDM